MPRNTYLIAAIIFSLIEGQPLPKEVDKFINYPAWVLERLEYEKNNQNIKIAYNKALQLTITKRIKNAPT